MARKRMLSADFFTSATLNALPIPTMVTFAGLWIYVDDFGRGEDDTALIKAVVWPRRRQMTEKKVGDDVELLAEAGVVCRYSVGRYDLLHVVSWAEHQKISHATPSKLPPCPSHEPAAWDFFLGDDDPALAKFRIVSGAAPESFESDSNTVQFSRGEGSSGELCAHGYPQPSLRSCASCRSALTSKRRTA